MGSYEVCVCVCGGGGGGGQEACVCVYVCVLVIQSHPTLCDPMDYRLPGSSVQSVISIIC